MLQFGVLGPLTVYRAGERLVVPSGRARVLLGALIVYTGSPLSVDSLVDMLWGRGRPPRTAATALHGHVSRLRKVLGDGAVVTTPGGYLLAAGADEVDSGRFRALVAQAPRRLEPAGRSGLLRKALGLWRGQALADFCYEPFAQSDIAALEEMRVTAVEDAIEADLAMGRHSALVGELQGLVRQYPLRERLWGHLMIALYRSGRQAEALATYREARRRMVDELGVDPGPALRELEAAVLRQDTGLVAPIMLLQHRLAGPGGPAIRRIDRVEAQFVGRSGDLDRLDAILTEVTARRRPVLVTVVGEPGMGKSRLAGEFTAGVRDRVTVLTGDCEPNVDGTYAPVYQLLAQARVGPDDPAAKLVAKLVEALDGSGGAAGGPVVDTAATRFFAALAAQRTVLLVLEDIHWAQPGLLNLIETLAANTDAAVMLLCLARPELIETRPAFGVNTDEAVFIELGHLAPAEIRNMVLDIAEPGASPDAIDEIVSVAAGNPLFAMQLVAWASDTTGSARPIPSAVRTLLANRINALGPGEHAVLQCAAIVGREFSAEAITALMPIEAKSTVERHCGALAQRQLIQPSSHGYQFRHDLIHRCTYVAMDPGIRARLHEQYTDWLTEHATADSASPDEIIGYHLEQAYDNLQTVGMRDEHARRLGIRAATHLGAAGRRAFRRADLPGAASLLSRALRLVPHDHPQRLSLLLAAGRPLRTSGRTAEAVAALLEAIDRAHDTGDVVIEWRARLELAFLRACVAPGDDVAAEMLRVAEKAVTALNPVQDDEGLSYAWRMIAYARESSGELTQATVAYQRARRHTLRAPPSPDDAAIAWGLASVLLEGPTPVRQAIAQCRELLKFRGQDQPGVMLDLAVLLAMNTDFDQARTLLAQAAESLRERGARRPPLFHAHASARVELAASQPEQAEHYARHGLALGVALGGDETDNANAIILARSLCQQRRTDEAAEVIAAHAGRSGQEVAQRAWWNTVRAQVRTHRSAWADAVELASHAVASIDHTGLFNLRAELRLTLAAALHGAGDITGAGKAATTALNLFQAKGNIVSLATARELLEHPTTIARPA